MIREGRALFAGDKVPLDEQMVTTDRVLEDASEERWVVRVPLFADPRWQHYWPSGVRPSW